jgi:predicted ATP-binding protein involved in virulence
MKVRELQFTNYRRFDESPTFQFGEQFTVIAGVNGRGKTSILDGLAILLGRLLPHISPARSGYRSISPSDIHQEMPSAKLSMKVNCAGYPIDYHIDYEREGHKLIPKKLPKSLKNAVRTAYSDHLLAGDSAPLAVYYTTDRAWYRHPKSLTTQLRRGQSAAYAGALLNRTVNFREFMSRYRARIALAVERSRNNPNYLGDRAVEAISTAVTTFLGGFTNLRIQENPLRLMVDKNGVPLDLTQLSDGERSFLALICDLGRRLSLANPELENPLHGAGVVIIDELELHLHPNWQREVVDNLRSTFPNIQFIATTHSPFVVQSLRSGAELIMLDGHPTAELGNKGIEEIARGLMGVPRPDVSERYEDMKEAALRYLELLEEAAGSPAEKLEAYKQRLAEGIGPYADNPAFQAFLEMKRAAKLGE